MKKLLVIGTSHTFGSCWQPDDAMARLPLEQRWHTIVAKELGYEVTTLAISGATIEQQMHTVFRYFKAFPDVRFDQAIIEGRHMGKLNVTYPKPDSKGRHDIADFDSVDKHETFLEGWLNDHTEKSTDRLLPFMGWNSSLPPSRNRQWYEEYTFSPLHFIHGATGNLALCKYLEDYCSNVLWMSFGQTRLAYHWNDWLYDFVKDYTHEDLWPVVKYPNGEECKCGHPNAVGHNALAQQIIKVLRKEDE